MESFNHLVALTKQDKRPFDVVVVWYTSRFGRNMDEYAVNTELVCGLWWSYDVTAQALEEGSVIMDDEHCGAAS